MERWYPDELQRSPLARFRGVLDEIVRPEDDVIDLGAGAGEINAYDLRGRVHRIVGVDLNKRVHDNPLLDEGIVADLGAVPIPSASFDLAISIYVLEHVQDPAAVATETSRLLRPGGLFVALTPSRYHYVPLVAAATPTRFHRWVNEHRGRSAEDTFPTAYRLNSRGKLRRVFGAAGFETVALETFEVAPHYLKFSFPSFAAGAAYERLVNRFQVLSPLRVNILGIFRKLP